MGISGGARWRAGSSAARLGTVQRSLSRSVHEAGRQPGCTRAAPAVAPSCCCLHLHLHWRHRCSSSPALLHRTLHWCRQAGTLGLMFHLRRCMAICIAPQRPRWCGWTRTESPWRVARAARQGLQLTTLFSCCSAPVPALPAPLPLLLLPAASALAQAPLLVPLLMLCPAAGVWLRVHGRVSFLPGSPHQAQRHQPRHLPPPLHPACRGAAICQGLPPADQGVRGVLRVLVGAAAAADCGSAWQGGARLATKWKRSASCSALPAGCSASCRAC